MMLTSQLKEERQALS